MPHRLVLPLLALALLPACREEMGQSAAPEPSAPWSARGESEARVTVLSDNPASFAARWRLLDEADERLDVAYFILHDDVFGLAFVGRLLEKAGEGVSVRLLLDARGSSPLVGRVDTSDPLTQLAAHEGIEVRVYNPPLRSLDRVFSELSPLLAVARSHLKVILADGGRSIVGGRNISHDYFATAAELATAAYDVDLLVSGRGVCGDLEQAFLGDWNGGVARVLDPSPVVGLLADEELLLYARAMDIWLQGGLGELASVPSPTAALLEAAGEQLPAAPSSFTRAAARPLLAELVSWRSGYGALRAAPAAPAYGATVSVLYDQSVAEDTERSLRRQLFSALQTAKREVHIESPYVVLTQEGLAVLARLAEQGVTIHLLTNGPRSSDNDLSQALFIEAWPELMARVPTLRLYVADGPQLMHAKRLVVDDRLTLVGTYNLDLLSALVNSEVMLAARSAPLARENRRLMRERRERGSVVEYKVARDSAGQALRYPEGHPRAGEVVVAFGPDAHVKPSTLEQLRLLRDLLEGLDNFAGMEPALF